MHRSLSLRTVDATLVAALAAALSAACGTTANTKTSSAPPRAEPSSLEAIQAFNASAIVPAALTEESFAASFRGDTSDLRGRLQHIEGHAAYVVMGDDKGVAGREVAVTEDHLAIVLLHTRAGISQTDKRWADRLATYGYAVVVPKLGADAHPAGAPTNLTEYDAIRAAVEFARDSLEIRAKQVVFLGFGDGAAHALRLGRMDGLVDAIIVYDPPKGSTIPSDLPVVAFDTSGTVEGEKNLIVVDVDAKEGFADPTNPNYALAEAKEAWNTVRGFLQLERDPYLATGN